ncbi:tyramine receptor Ser-2-like [Paramacrobiotus metropolitanus]|uniref:tyramine receptor Ser-2-like n=1 Tax=Paramacrobiotus metropolitanus TaxID=2943436 RepID=UPI002445B6A3|nr:tyramine receptor Ser-2-like [Paramacrobiotus metropolitanus]
MNLSGLLGNFSNATLAHQPENSSHWKPFPIAVLVIICLGAVLNILVLLTFLKSGAIRTPFNIYLVNLLITNLLHVVLIKPLEVASNVLGGWTLGYSACTYFLYALYIINAEMIHAHALISINRIWAVTFPISYKYRHTKVTAIAICVANWIYVNALLLPQIIRDAVWYRELQITPFCFLHVKPQYSLIVFTEFWCYVVPAVVIAGAFPYVMCKRRKRTIAFVTEEPNPEIATVGSIKVSLRSGHKGTIRPGGPNDTPSELRTSGPQRSSGYMIFTALTVTVLVCWIPNIVFFKMNLLVEYYDTTVYEIVASLFMLQAVTDPVFFIISLKDIRANIRKIFCLSV